MQIVKNDLAGAPRTLACILQREAAKIFIIIKIRTPATWSGRRSVPCSIGQHNLLHFMCRIKRRWRCDPRSGLFPKSLLASLLQVSSCKLLAAAWACLLANPATHNEEVSLEDSGMFKVYPYIVWIPMGTPEPETEIETETETHRRKTDCKTEHF